MLVVLQPFGQGHHVERLVVVREYLECAVDRAVVPPVEIVGGNALCDVGPGIVIQHQAAEYGLLGLDGMRRNLERLRRDVCRGPRRGCALYDHSIGSARAGK